MKRLSLLRHAKSRWDQPDLDDLNRPLNDRGWKDARRMGRELKERDIRFDFVLASPAARVRETIDALKETLKLNVEIRFEPRMYAASEDILLELVHELSESCHVPLLVGHNPGLERLAVALTLADRHHYRARVADKFPTAALAMIELPAHRWKEVEKDSGEIAGLILPKEL